MKKYYKTVALDRITKEELEELFKNIEDDEEEQTVAFEEEKGTKAKPKLYSDLGEDNNKDLEDYYKQLEEKKMDEDYYNNIEIAGDLEADKYAKANEELKENKKLEKIIQKYIDEGYNRKKAEELALQESIIGETDYDLFQFDDSKIKDEDLCNSLIKLTEQKIKICEKMIENDCCECANYILEDEKQHLEDLKNCDCKEKIEE